MFWTGGDCFGNCLFVSFYQSLLIEIVFSRCNLGRKLVQLDLKNWKNFKFFCKYIFDDLNCLFLLDSKSIDLDEVYTKDYF